MKEAGNRKYNEACHAQDGGATGFQDNDSLAKELAKELNADLLVLLTNVDGLLDGPPKDRTSKWVNPSFRPPTCCMSLDLKLYI